MNAAVAIDGLLIRSSHAGIVSKRRKLS